VLTDGCVGQMMEPVDFPTDVQAPPKHDWAVRGDAETRKNLINSIFLSHDELEAHNRHLNEKYARAAADLPEWRSYQMEDATTVFVGYGIVGRVLRNVVDLARKNGIRAGLIRPITLWPFPSAAIAEAADHAERFFVSELSAGQMVDDVRIAVNGKRPVTFYGRQGGNVPTATEIYEVLTGEREAHHA